MSEERIYTTMKRHVLEVMPDVDPQSITMDCRLSDLGLNSIDRADVLAMTMEDLAISVPIMEFRKGSDIRTLVAVFGKYS